MSMPVHRYETAEGVRWHWAEMGDGDPVVLLHGIPESWMCWKHQMSTLATQFRVLAFDLKGYGRSEKADGDYTGNGVARELLACLDKIGIERFRLAGHDWGVMVGDHVVDQAPDRVERYLRCCLSLHTYDVRNSLHHQWNGENPQAAARLMRKAQAYVRVWMESSCKEDLVPDDAEILEMAAEFANEGVAEAVPQILPRHPQERVRWTTRSSRCPSSTCTASTIRDSRSSTAEGWRTTFPAWRRSWCSTAAIS